MSEQKFYSGLDVEYIRQICESLHSSVSCMRQKLSRQCADHSNLDSILEPGISDLINVAKLCQYSNLYEVYARHMSCYQRQAVQHSSQTCYSTYRQQTDSIMSRVIQKHTHSLQQMCLHYTTLVSCIRSHVKSHCTPAASELTELLVAPSINMSEHCTELPPTTVIPTSPVLHSRQAGYQNTEDTVKNNSFARLKPQPILFILLVLILTLLML